MRIGLIALLFMIFGCAEAPLRRFPASETAMRIGSISRANSLVQLFPSNEGDSFTYYFYLQLKNEKGDYVDCDPSEVTLKTKQKKLITFKLERLLTGRYYLIVNKSKGLKDIDVYVRGLLLKEKFNLNLIRPDKKFTSITIKKKGDGKIVFRLKLADKTNKPVALLSEPEIVFEGRGEIDNLRHMQEGIWEFTVIYPEDNQIMYFSVRAQGIYLTNLLRYQHIEK